MTSFASYPRDHAARVELLPSHSGGVVAGETKPRLCLAQVIAQRFLERVREGDCGSHSQVQLLCSVVKTDPALVVRSFPSKQVRLTCLAPSECPLDRLGDGLLAVGDRVDRSEETRLNSSHVSISYAVFCLKKKKRH